MKITIIVPKKRRVLEMMFDFVGRFQGGLAPVRKNGQWFHITRDGEPAYGARFTWVSKFNDSKTRAEASNRSGKIFEIDRHGKRVKPSLKIIKKNKKLSEKYADWLSDSVHGDILGF